MERYWKDYQGDDESFWEHEWSKHGTCVSTLDPECYDGYEPAEEVAPYFDRVVSLFKKLPTYDWLADADITPDTSASYSIDDVQSVLDGKHGATVSLGCDGDQLNEAWYFFNVKGSLQSGEFVPAEPAGGSTSCPSSVKYTPKSGGGSGNSTLRRSRAARL